MGFGNSLNCDLVQYVCASFMRAGVGGGGYLGVHYELFKLVPYMDHIA
jgi:hypothetical protein